MRKVKFLTGGDVLREFQRNRTGQSPQTLEKRVPNGCKSRTDGKVRMGKDEEKCVGGFSPPNDNLSASLNFFEKSEVFFYGKK